MHILPVKIFRYLIFRFCIILSIIWRNIAESIKQKKNGVGWSLTKYLYICLQEFGPIIQSLYTEYRKYKC